MAWEEADKVDKDNVKVATVFVSFVRSSTTFSKREVFERKNKHANTIQYYTTFGIYAIFKGLNSTVDPVLSVPIFYSKICFCSFCYSQTKRGQTHHVLRGKSKRVLLK